MRGVVTDAASRQGAAGRAVWSANERRLLNKPGSAPCSGFSTDTGGAPASAAPVEPKIRRENRHTAKVAAAR